MVKMKTGGSTSDETAFINNCYDANGSENHPRGQHNMDSAADDRLVPNFCKSKYEIDGDNEDADDVNNDSGTSTSFSLQECMNEFRARRIRRTSLYKHRQEVDKLSVCKLKNFQGATELELIKQNMCNKEQERKCKPCQNGFCYCFTSDSGDGGPSNLGVCPSGATPVKNTRCIKPSDGNQFLNSGKRNTNSPRPNEESSLNFRKSTVRKTTKSTNRFKAISNLETSKNDAPLIHIIQELRDNCVISTVKVNKYKMQSFGKKLCSKEKITHISKNENSFMNQGHPKKHIFIHKKPFFNARIPTAPIFERDVDLESDECNKNIISTSLETNKQLSNCPAERCTARGQLLYKRISISNLSYKPTAINQSPPKPPRASLTNTGKYCASSVSTSSSVRQAERVIDNFLEEKGATIESTTNNDWKSRKGTERYPLILFRKIVRKSSGKTINKKSARNTPNKHKKQHEQMSLTYPPLSEVGIFLGSKKLPLYGKNMRPSLNNTTKAVSIGWNEAEIRSMLTYDADAKQREFYCNSTQAEPQQIHSSDVVESEKSIGWQIPPKINLDTVDGIVHHNLVSNLEDKNTPVKTNLISPSQNEKNGSRRQKFLWSEQLKYLSPWSNKCNIADTNESKQNLRCCSKAFIISSKKKLIHLVTPKKRNRSRNSIQIRDVGVQTSCSDISCGQANIDSPYQDRSSPQSPPGSYHSPIQSVHTQYAFSTQSQNSTPNDTDPQFDFSRTVHSPPKKPSCSSQRKLIFPLNCASASGEHATQNSDNKKKTYCSFNSDLDQDVSISKISYVLTNIRAKLEASDQQAMRTFLETKSVVDHNLYGFNCPDNHHKSRMVECVEFHKPAQLKTEQDNFSEPIYSEIQDDSVYIAGNSEFDNHTAIQHYVTSDNPDILYAEVNKSTKWANKLQLKKLKPQKPLAKIMQDSLKIKNILSNIVPLPTLAEPIRSGSTSNSLSSTMPLSHCQSLNNVQLMEHDSFPKTQRNLSKSDLSLHRSNFFLENLWKSDLIVHTNQYERKNLEKIHNENNNTQNSYCSVIKPTSNAICHMISDEDLSHTDNVSYELPNDEVNCVNEFAGIDNSLTTGINLGLSSIVPQSNNKQSTPKKQSFVAKDISVTSELNMDDKAVDISDHLYKSYPNTSWKQGDICMIDKQNSSHSLSTNGISKYESMNKSNGKNIKKTLKNVLHKSFRKGRAFIRNEGKYLSTSLNLSVNKSTISPTLSPVTPSLINSNLNLDILFSFNESATISEKIAETVSVCRKVPDLEFSMEMVEAERLLLFSELCRENHRQLSSTAKKRPAISQKSIMRFFIDDLFLPVLSSVNVDIFYNYFYIITFECGGVVKSTQSAECVNGTVVFRDNGIEFAYCQELEADTLITTDQHAVKCSIFMLRLRKISTALMEPNKKTTIQNLTNFPSPSTSSSSLNKIVSRFRLHASFTLDAKDFVPYEYVHQESDNSDRICIRASRFCTLPLKDRSESANLPGYIRLKGRSEVRALKHVFHGFLNVQDPHKQHNWNRRWCKLDGIFLYVWQDKSILNTSPLIVIDLRDSTHNINFPLTCSPRELCARPRSFCLECNFDKSCKDVSTVPVFFAADTQENVDDWLKSLNLMLDFIVKWF